jgi:hypothetical protein
MGPIIYSNLEFLGQLISIGEYPVNYIETVFLSHQLKSEKIKIPFKYNY